MADINQLVALSKNYLSAQDKMKRRFSIWNDEKKEMVGATLTEIANAIIENNEYFKNNLYVKMKGSSPAVAIWSGKVPTTNSGETEHGFEINFIPIMNGKIQVNAIGHSIEENKFDSEVIEIFDDPGEITRQKVIDLVYEGLSFVFRTSFLCIGDD